MLPAGGRDIAPGTHAGRRMFNVVGRDYLVGVGYGDGGVRLILGSCDWEAGRGVDDDILELFC